MTFGRWWMFFKRLEISGFKSFARKTQLEFQDGVTIVVGPNGCGKSNIFDAARWVLGEQRVKSLRASKMGDVIFSGTSQIKPANYAQVSLAVDNRSSLLPIDVKEIIITRRLFSDGESQYLINRVPCRLKDIHELFMDTGIGTSAYSMMEQGQVDFIISARPQERREIFDEAAGIARYKARKAEALRKLDRTNDDLLRISDIIAEVKRTLNSLKRQASRTRRYKEFKEQQEEIEKILLCRRGEQITVRLAEVEQNFVERQDTLLELNSRTAKLEALWQDGQVKTEELQKAHSEAQASVFSLHSEIEQLKQKSSLLRERINEYREREQGFGTENRSIETKIHELTERESRLVEHLEKVNLELGEIEGNLSDKESQLSEILEHRKEFDDKFHNLNATIDELYEQRTSLFDQIREHELDLSRYEVQLSELGKDIDETRQQKSTVQQRIQNQHHKKDVLDKEIGELTSRVDSLTHKEKETKQRCSDLNREKAALEKEQQELKAEERMLKQVLENYEGFNDGVKEVMRAVRDGETSHSVTVLTDVLQVDAEMERAIESVMAEKLQYLLVTNTEDAMKTINILESGRKHGRAVILPGDNERLVPKNGKSLPDRLHIEPVLGKALDFIRCKQDLEKVIDALLGDVVIVADRQTALDLASDHEYTFVTRDGCFIVGASGEFIVGNGKNNGHLLGRRRRLESIGRQLDRVEQRLQQALKDIDVSSTDLESLFSSIKELLDQRKEKEIHRSVFEREIDTLTSRLDELTTRKQSLNDHADSIKGASEQLRDSLSESRDSIDDIEERLDSCNEEKETIIASTTSADREINDVKTALQALQTDQALAVERKKTLEEQVQQIRLELEEHKETASRRTREFSRLKEDRANAEEELARCLTLIDTKNQEHEVCDHRLKAKEQDLEEIQNKVREWQHECQVTQRDRNALENEVNDIKVKVAELKTQADYLDEQAREKFRVSLKDLQRMVEETDDSTDELQEKLADIRRRLERIGPINPQALEDYERQQERYDFLLEQQKDLIEAKESLEKTIKTIDTTSQQLFDEAFTEIRQNFIQIFRRLFGGGRAELNLMESDDPMEAGIEIVAQPPGKKLSHISLLSGGERALTAISLMFALFLRKPSPFCILDEIDAPLDDANIELFKKLLKEFIHDVQFIIVTHNKRTMMMGDTIYGITMEEAGVSKVISLSMEEVGTKVPVE